MGDLRLVQFGTTYDQRQANTMVDILEKVFSNISTIFAQARRSSYQLHSDTTQVGNVGSGEDTLISYSIPANTLALDGYNLEIKAWGTYASNANNKTVKAIFGSTTLYTTGAVAANGGDWFIEATIVRTGSATQQAITSIISSNSSVVDSVTFTTPSQTLSNAIVFKCTGEATSNNDIIQKGLLVRVIPQE